MAYGPIIPPGNADLYYRFSLEIGEAGLSLIPGDQELRVHLVSGHFCIVYTSTGQLASEGTFSQEVLPIILVLLNNWPSYVQNHKLMNALGYASGSDADLDDEQHLLVRMRQLIHASVPSLQSIGIDIQAIDDLGYKLSKHTESQTEHRE